MASYLGRRKFLAMLGGAAAAWPLAARAQQSERMRRIGILLLYAENDPEGSHYIARLLEGLRQSGWTPGHNIQIDYRWGGADRGRFERYATELVELKPDLLVGQGTPAVAALQRATRTIPIVFVNVSNPIGSGFIESLARPGSNITGFSNFEPSMGGKWVELLKETAPQVAWIALMSNPQTSPQARGYLPSIESAARSLALQPIDTPVHNAAEIERAIASLGRDAAGGLVMLSDVFTLANRELVVKLANQHRVPAVYPFGEFAKSGGLLSYGVDMVLQFRQAAPYVDRILKGAAPGDLPVQAPTKFQLIVNLKTARMLGIEIPTTLLARADEVIE